MRTSVLMGQVFKKNHGMGDATPQPSSPLPPAITTTPTTMPPSSTRGKLEHKTRNIVCCRPLSNLFSGIAVQEVFRRFPRSPHETISFNKRSLFFSFKKKNWWKSSFNSGFREENCDLFCRGMKFTNTRHFLDFKKYQRTLSFNTDQ